MGGEKKDCTFPDDVQTSPLLLYLLRIPFPCSNLRTAAAAQHNRRCHCDPTEKTTETVGFDGFWLLEGLDCFIYSIYALLTGA